MEKQDLQDEVDAERQKELKKEKLVKSVKTAFLFIPFLCMGLSMELYGPAMHDLKTQTNSSYESVAQALSCRGFGFFVGSLVGGFLVDRFGISCDLINGHSLNLMAAISATVPWIRSVQPLGVLAFIHGCSEGALSNALAKIVLKLWKTEAASPLNAVTMGFGIGSCLVSVIANAFVGIPYIPPRNDNDQNTFLNQSIFNISKTVPYVVAGNDSLENVVELNVTSGYIREPRLEYAFLITACMSVLVSIICYVFYFIDKRSMSKAKASAVAKRLHSEKRTVRAIFNPATCAGGRFFYGLRLLALLSFYYFNAWGGLRVCGQMTRIFSIEHLNFTPTQGSYVNAAFWMSFSVGRIIAALITNKVHIRTYLLLQGGLYLLAATLMNIFAHSMPFSLWILSPLLGLSISPLYPTGLGWANYHMDVTGLVITLFMLGGSVGGVVLMCLVGYLYDHHGPRSFLYQVQGSGILIFIIVISLHFVGGKHGQRPEESIEIYIEAETEKPLENKKKELEMEIEFNKNNSSDTYCPSAPMLGSQHEVNAVDA